MNIFLKATKAKLEIESLKIESPGYKLWDSILSQINFILDDFDKVGGFKNKASVDRVKQIILGVQAIREIEPGNMSLADLLCEIDYEYKKLYNLID